MSLIQCPECGKEISNEAKACPNCGHPIKSKNNKHSKGIIVIAALCGIVALFVCISAFSDAKKAISVKKSDESTISSNSETKDSEKEQQPKVAFTVNTDEELANLPDTDDYIDSIVSTAKSIGITDIVQSEFGNYKKISGVHLVSAKCKTDTSINIIIDSIYAPSTDAWTTVSIRDFITGNYYFVQKEQIPYFDLYDYKTGNIISQKTKNLEEYDAVDEFNKQSEEIDKDFQESLNEIAEKYKTPN